MTEGEKIEALVVLNTIISCDDAFGNDEDKELIKTAKDKRKVIVESLSIDKENGCDDKDGIIERYMTSNTMLRAEVLSLNTRTNDLQAKIRGLEENRDLWKQKYSDLIAHIADKTFSDIAKKQIIHNEIRSQSSSVRFNDPEHTKE